jgi:hypothetical protein
MVTFDGQGCSGRMSSVQNCLSVSVEQADVC